MSMVPSVSSSRLITYRSPMPWARAARASGRVLSMMLAWRMKMTTGPGPASSTPSTSKVRPMMARRPATWPAIQRIRSA